MNVIRYDEDFVSWSTQQAELLRAGDFGALDIENLAEEVESLGTSQRSELRRRLTVLLMHMLKWEFQIERRSRSWVATLMSQRREIEDLLETSPSLRRTVPEVITRAFGRARIDAELETGLLHLPDFCPWTIDQVLDPTPPVL